MLELDAVRVGAYDVGLAKGRMDGANAGGAAWSNGCGKTTLLKTLLGLELPIAGRCRLSVNAAYLDQHLTQLDLSLSVAKHLNLGDTPRRSALRSQLAQLQLGADKVDSAAIGPRAEARAEGGAGLRTLAA